MACMDHISELIIAVTPIILGIWGSHCTLKKNINSNNGDSAKQTEEVEKLIAAIKEFTRGD